MLIFGHELRNIPYSDEEAAVGQKLINLYYNFANFNNPVYENLKLEKVSPDNVKCLEITKSAEIVELHEDFGKTMFWDDIEQILFSKERTFFDTVSERDEL